MEEGFGSVPDEEPGAPMIKVGTRVKIKPTIETVYVSQIGSIVRVDSTSLMIGAFSRSVYTSLRSSVAPVA